MKSGACGLLASLLLLSCVSYGNASPDTEPALLRNPDSAHTYAAGESDWGNSQKSPADYKVCQYLGIAPSCAIVSASFKQVVATFGSVMTSRESAQDCATVYGTAGGATVKYRYFSVRRDCVTETELKLIVGAIEHHLNTKADGKLCRTECVDLTQSHVWNGYLLVGPADRFESDMYCGPVLGLQFCFRSERD